MEPITPFWFKQRQCKLEPAGSDNVRKASGPNLAEAYLQVEPGAAGRWTAALKQTADGPAVATAEAEYPSARAAWDVAFELYRQYVIA